MERLAVQILLVCGCVLGQGSAVHDSSHLLVCEWMHESLVKHFTTKLLEKKVL